ncbi:transposase [Streptomyces sp. NPDC058457]|uniref:transposase n=1 Tax=Streptomyces sp. NPDC058457 TaxID=3346507 RepID=UPI003660BD52
MTKAWADTGYHTKAIDHGVRHGIDVEVVQRDPGVRGFKAIPRRWVVERTFGRLMHHRRLARDYETHPHRSEAIIHVAMIDLWPADSPANPPRTGTTPEPRTRQPTRNKTPFQPTVLVKVCSGPAGPRARELPADARSHQVTVSP